MKKERRAVVFPEFETVTKNELSSYSETTLQRSERSFLDRISLSRSVTNLISQKVITNQLGKRIAVSKMQLDTEYGEAEEQFKVQCLEQMKRLDAYLESEKKQIELQFEKTRLEIKKKMEEESLSFESALRKSELFKTLIYSEKKNIYYFQEQIDLYKGDIERSREYICYLDMLKNSIDFINNCLNMYV